MKNSRNSFLTLFLGFLFIGLTLGDAVAQIQNPVKWEFKSKSLGDDVVELQFIATIDDGFHLYSMDIPPDGPIPTSFIIPESNNYELLGEMQESQSISEYDALFEMTIKFFSDEAVFKQKIRVKSEEDFRLSGTFEYMVCNDETCVPFYDNDYSFNISGVVMEAATEDPDKLAEETDNQTSEIDADMLEEELKADTAEKVSANNTAEPEAPTLNNEVVTDNKTDEEEDSMLAFFLLALGLGIVGAFTPCVYPMIPMTVSFFLNSSGSKAQGRLKALFYGFSIVFIYTVLGLLVTLFFGANAIKIFADHWLTNLIFYLIFVVFAASFFGMFEIVLPSRWVNKSDKQADKGGYVGVFFMALTLVIVSVSCTAPFVGTLLIEASKGQVLKPAIGMFGFSFTFALPFVIFALFPALLKSMPKSGGWMNSMKVVLAFLILAFGTKFLSVTNTYLGWNIPREVFIAYWIVLFLMLGLYLLGKIRFSHDSALTSIKVPRLFLAMISFVFAISLLPGLIGAPVKTIAIFIPEESSFNLKQIIESRSFTSGDKSAERTSKALCDEPRYSDQYHVKYNLPAYFEYKQGLECAKKLNKPVLLDFKSKACVNCKKIENSIWSDEGVQKLIREEYVLIVLYSDQRTELPEEEWVTSSINGKVKKTAGLRNKDFQISRFGTNGEPYYVILDTNGNQLMEGIDFSQANSVENYTQYLKDGLAKFERNLIK